MSLPTLTVELAFATDPDVSTPAYVDISAYVMSLSIRRGRNRELDAVQAATCEIRLKNGDRRFDPSYTYSPYYPYVLPMRKIRVSATFSAVTYYLFTGYVERWPIEWQQPRWGSVTITAVDGMAALAQADIAGSFPQELSGARISRVLSAAAWPDSTPASGAYCTLDTSTLDGTAVLSYGIPATVIAAGQTQVQAVTFNEGDSTSALAHIQDVAAAERGVFFVDGQGRAIFQDRQARYGTSSVVTFTDGSTSASRIPYVDLQPEFDVERIANEVIVTRTGGTAQSAQDGTSRARYFRRTLPLTPPLISDAEALDRANYELWLRKDPRLEFPRVTVSAQTLDAVIPHALGRELGDRATVERTPGSDDPITVETIVRDCYIEAVTHDARPGGPWTTSFQLSPADAYGQFLTLGAAVLNSSATAVLAY